MNSTKNPQIEISRIRRSLRARKVNTMFNTSFPFPFPRDEETKEPQRIVKVPIELEKSPATKRAEKPAAEDLSENTGTLKTGPKEDLAEDGANAGEALKARKTNASGARAGAGALVLDARNAIGTSAGVGLLTVPNYRGRRHTLETDLESPSYDLGQGLKLLYIINNDDFTEVNRLRPLDKQLSARIGSQQDVYQINKTFKPLGYKIEVFHNQTDVEIRQLLEGVQKTSVRLACFALFILSHGEENGIIWARESCYNLNRDVIEPLANQNCTPLAGKPKLLFLQCCQGNRIDEGTIVKAKTGKKYSMDLTDAVGLSPSSMKVEKKLPNYSDIFVFKASYDGFISFRNDEGSWFIQTLCQKIEESDPKMDLNAIAVQVTRRIALDREANNPNFNEPKQVPYVQHTLLRSIFLKGNPTADEEEGTTQASTEQEEKEEQIAEKSEKKKKTSSFKKIWKRLRSREHI